MFRVPGLYRQNMCSDPIARRTVLAGFLFVQLWLYSLALADEVEKILFLVVEKRDVIASNTRAGRFDRLEMHAKETVRDYKVANATAVVITNQRFSAYGALAGGWQSKRRQAGEKVQSIEVADYSATLVTSDRILNFYGRSGTWSEIRRGVQ